MLRRCEGLGGGGCGGYYNMIWIYQTELSNKECLKLMKLSETLHGD